MIQWDTTKKKIKDLPMIDKFVEFRGHEFIISKERLHDMPIKLRISSYIVGKNNKGAMINFPSNAIDSLTNTWIEIAF